MKNGLQSLSEIRNYVDKQLKGHQAKKTSFENRNYYAITTEL
jgi:hypothetical protein